MEKAAQHDLLVAEVLEANSMQGKPTLCQKELRGVAGQKPQRVHFELLDGGLFDAFGNGSAWVHDCAS